MPWGGRQRVSLNTVGRGGEERSDSSPRLSPRALGALLGLPPRHVVVVEHLGLGTRYEEDEVSWARPGRGRGRGRRAGFGPSGARYLRKKKFTHVVDAARGGRGRAAGLGEGPLALRGDEAGLGKRAAAISDP